MSCTNYEMINCITGVFTAVGTVGAVFISLALALHNRKPRINALFICGSPTTDQPVMLIQNTSKLDVVLEHIDVYYDKKRIKTIDFLDDSSFSDYAIIKARETKQVPLPTTILTEPKTEGKKKRTLKIVVFQRHGRKHTTKERITDEEMMKLCFCCELSRDRD